MRQVSSPSTGSSRTSDLKTQSRFESKNSVPCGWKYSVDEMDCSEIPILVVKEEQSAEKNMLNLIEDDFV